VFVDIAGSTAIRTAVHQQLGGVLRQSIIVGSTHQDLHTVSGLPGPEPMPFFAPTWIKLRNQQWTPEVVRRRVAEAWRGFVAAMLDPSRRWMTIASGTGFDAVSRTYDEILAGRTRPDEGHVFML
jgi:hypothetical protein